MDEKRRRVDLEDDQDQNEDPDLNSEEEQELKEVVNSFFSSTVSTAEKEDDEKRREKLEKRLKERQTPKPPPVQLENDPGDAVADDFDDELSFLMSENVALAGEKDIRKVDALYAKNLPYLS